jgi:N6-L-threonylcarbamoyladenine synthase
MYKHGYSTPVGNSAVKPDFRIDDVEVRWD